MTDPLPTVLAPAVLSVFCTCPDDASAARFAEPTERIRADA